MDDKIIVVSKPCYCKKFEDLSEEDKHNVLSRYIHYDLSPEWGENIINTFKENVKIIGVSLSRVVYDMTIPYSESTICVEGFVNTSLFLKTLPKLSPSEKMLLSFLDKNVVSLKCTLRALQWRTSIQLVDMHIDIFTPVSCNDNNRIFIAANKLENKIRKKLELYTKTLKEHLYQEYDYRISEANLSRVFAEKGCIFEIGTGVMFNQEV